MRSYITLKIGKQGNVQMMLKRRNRKRFVNTIKAIFIEITNVLLELKLERNEQKLGALSTIYSTKIY